jgi:hypothetical protein
MIKTLKKLGIQGSHLSMIKAARDKPVDNIALNEKKLKYFL